MQLNYIYIASLLIVFNALIFLFKIKYDYIIVSNVVLLSVAILEPSPADILFISLVLFSFKFKIVDFKKLRRQCLPILYIAGFILLNLLSGINIIKFSEGVKFFLITAYLLLYSVIIFMYASEGRYSLIIKAYILSSTVSVVLGILGYVGIMSEYLTYDSYRTQSLFKDPNVFGPFLVPAIILLIDDLKRKRYIIKSIFITLGLIALNITGLILSFSRGAWVSFVFGIIVYFMLNLRRINYLRLAAFAAAWVGIAAGLWFWVLTSRWKDFFLERVGLKGYDSERFRVQFEGLRLIFHNFFGYGPGQYETAVLNSAGIERSAHNLYIRILVENGILAFICLGALVLYLLIRLIKINRMEGKSSELRSSALVAILSGILVNSLVIDTLHWRHFWLFTGLAVALIDNYIREKQLKPDFLTGAIMRWMQNRPPRIIKEGHGEVYNLDNPEKAGGLRIKVIEDIEELKGYRVDWDWLLRDNGNDIVFLELDWIIKWWKYFGEGRKMHVVAVQGDRYIEGFLPLMITKKGPIKEINFIGYPQAHFMDFILWKRSQKEALELMAEHLLNLKGLHVIELFGMFEDSENLALLKSFLEGHKSKYFTWRIESAYLNIKGRFEEYYKTKYPAHQRKNIERCKRRLSELGVVSYGQLEPDRIDEIFEIHDKRWLGKNDGSNFSRGNTRKFYRELALSNDLSFKTYVSVLRVDEKIIAFKYGCRCGGRDDFFRVAHDVDFAAFSLGKLIQREKIDECFRDGTRILDFGTGYEPHKAQWTDSIIYVNKITFPANNTFSKIFYYKYFLKRKLANFLKRNKSVYYFLKNTVGKVKFMLTKDFRILAFKGLKSALGKLKNIWGVGGFIRRIWDEVYFSSYYTILEGGLKGHTCSEGLEGIRIQEARIDDFERLAQCMNKRTEKIVERYYYNQKCFIAVKEDKIIHYSWVGFNNVYLKGRRYGLQPSKALIYDSFTLKEYNNQGIEDEVIGFISQFLLKKKYSSINILKDRKHQVEIDELKDKGFDRSADINIRGGMFVKGENRDILISEIQS